MTGARARATAARDTDLTADQQKHVRAAIKFLRLRCGTWEAVTAVLGFKGKYLADVARGNANASASVAFRVARFAKVGVDDVLSGRFPPSGVCPHCGEPLPMTG